MTDIRTPRFAGADQGAIPLHVIEAEGTMPDLPAAALTWAGTGAGKVGQVTPLPDGEGRVLAALLGAGDAQTRARGRFVTAGAASSLPKGTYRLESAGPEAAELFALGWLLESYRFTRYADQPEASATLVAPEGVDATKVERIAAAEYFARDLINTPAADMGPEEIEAAARTLADTHGADITVTTGNALLEANLPMIHAVGRASTRAPRLIDLRFGTQGPRLTLVGKGVAFDTGGLNLKPGSSMSLMKKDMGGSANVLALAHAIMASGWKVRLRVLIPAVENSVSGNAFRPGDILTARNGKTVEINNTDAEGRLVLADALALAAEEAPDQIISMATLTGAARVAVGPDIAPFYTGDDALAEAVAEAAQKVADPVWRMPFHEPYEAMIEPGIADLDNAPSGGFAGSITAALFLRRFTGGQPYAHFDIFGWNPNAAPARPKGGAGQGWRALFAALPGHLGL